MKSKNSILFFYLLMFGLLLSPLAAALADEVPPLGSKPLSLILKMVEEQKLGSITDAEFDDGLWELKVCAAAVCQKLYIDPKSGAEVRRLKTDSDAIPPANALALSTIILSVEARNPGIITEVDFDDGFWKVDLHKDGQKIRLVIDPKTGETGR